MATILPPEDPNWNALVSRTRLLVRAMGLAEFDDSFHAPDRFCGLDERPSDASIPDLRHEEVFRSYLQTALAILAPVGAPAAHRLREALNARLADPVTTIELQDGHQRWDLLSPDTYAAVDITRETLMAIAQHLGWALDPGPASTPQRRGPQR